MLASLTNLLFPRRHICLLCREKTSDAMEFICKDCYNHLDILHRQIAIDSKFISKAYYSLSYNRFIKEKMKDYKYNGKNYLSKPFGEIILETIRVGEIIKDIDLITYIPAHRRKEALRGYNQAELLASYISDKTDLPISRGNLIKTKWTKEQSHSNRLERLSNLKDSFHIKEAEKIKSKRILLIDDIITTGTTMDECAKVLINNGAREIIGLALTSSKIS